MIHIEYHPVFSVKYKKKLKMSSVAVVHYENTPIQKYWKFYHKKNEKNQIKNSDIFHFS